MRGSGALLLARAMSDALVVPDYSSSTPPPGEPTNGPPLDDVDGGGGAGVPIKPQVRVLGLAPINAAAGAVILLLVVIMVVLGQGQGESEPPTEPAGGGGDQSRYIAATRVGRFAAVPEVMSQEAAQLYCEGRWPSGGGLASIHTVADQAAAVEACRSLGPSTTWAGADVSGVPVGCCKPRKIRLSQSVLA